jgi:hypothetical protein
MAQRGIEGFKAKKCLMSLPGRHLGSKADLQCGYRKYVWKENGEPQGNSRPFN